MKEGIIPHQHVCCPVALLPGKKPLLGSFPRSVESLFLNPRLKSPFPKPQEDFVLRQHYQTWLSAGSRAAVWSCSPSCCQQTQSGVRREQTQLMGLLVGQKEGGSLLATEHLWWL